MSLFLSTSSSISNTVLPQVGDETAFIRYEEKFIFDLQHLLREKPGMDFKLSVLELAADLEDHLYRLVQERLSLENVAIFSRSEALDQFLKLTTDLLHRIAQTNYLDWSALYDEHHKHVPDIYEIIMGRKSFVGKSKTASSSKHKHNNTSNFLVGMGGNSNSKKNKVKSTSKKSSSGDNNHNMVDSNKKKTVKKSKLSNISSFSTAHHLDENDEYPHNAEEDEYDDEDEGGRQTDADMVTGASNNNNNNHNSSNAMEEDLLLMGDDDLGFDFDGDDMPMDFD